ncbi:MAG: hypothetical protein K9L65_17935 [Chromatiaceae bacterium]|nr:hypothetical protein [Chromatiaceae bacterium]
MAFPGCWCYILIVPLGALLLVLIMLTGVYDWLRNRLGRRRRQRRLKPNHLARERH